MAGLGYFLALVLIGMVVLYPVMIGRVSDETLNNMALTGLGAAIVVVSKGADWFMRGRVTAPTGDDAAGPPPVQGDNTRVEIPQRPPDAPIVVETNPRPPPAPP